MSNRLTCVFYDKPTAAYRVLWYGSVLAPRFVSRTAARAYIIGLRRGRTPEEWGETLTTSYQPRKET